MANPARYREHNRQLVLTALRDVPLLTRPMLMESTGLSRSTVGELVAELVAAGQVVESETVRSTNGAGRPARILALTRNAGLVGGLDYGHSHVHAAVATVDGRVLRETRLKLDVNRSPRDAIACGRDLLTDLARAEEADLSELRCVGIGLPAPVDPVSGMITGNNILPNWVDVDPSEQFRRDIGTSVQIDNDANLGARAELRAMGNPVVNLIYVKASTGIGAGIILNGSVFRGSRGIAGEIGHIQVPGAQDVCRCGSRGCLETVVSLTRIIRDLQPVHPDVTDVDGLIRLIDHRDPAATRLVGDAGRLIGRALADVCNFLAPDVIAIGGELSVAGEVFLEPMRQVIERHTQPMVMRALEVRPSANGGRAEIVGALALASESVNQL